MAIFSICISYINYHHVLLKQHVCNGTTVFMKDQFSCAAQCKLHLTTMLSCFLLYHEHETSLCSVLSDVK